MKTWLMFKDHYGRDLALPSKEKVTFTDRRFTASFTQKTNFTGSPPRSPWRKQRDRVEAYPVNHYLLLAGAILLVMGILYIVVL